MSWHTIKIVPNLLAQKVHDFDEADDDGWLVWLDTKILPPHPKICLL